MISIICEENTFSLINEYPDGIHVYYNKKHKRFEYHYENNIKSDNLIMTPCSYEMEPVIWREFDHLLSEEDAKIADNCPFDQKYLDYLQEVGLYETYQEAKHKAMLKELIVWFLVNRVKYPKNGIYIDCRYL